MSTGAGGPQHLQAMLTSVATIVMEEPEEFSKEIVRLVGKALESHREVFASHIDTHNCPTGHCEILTPAPCQMACPAGIDVASYVSAHRPGQICRGRGTDPQGQSLSLGLRPGLHPSLRICLRQGKESTAPIAIKDLKAFAAERAVSERTYRNPAKEPDMGYKVCVIGAGPAGLTAAYYLALKGYQVTVIEALALCGRNDDGGHSPATAFPGKSLTAKSPSSKSWEWNSDSIRGWAGIPRWINSDRRASGHFLSPQGPMPPWIWASRGKRIFRR